MRFQYREVNNYIDRPISKEVFVTKQTRNIQKLYIKIQGVEMQFLIKGSPDALYIFV